MTGQVHPQNIIALIWDFDNTLVPGSMQAPIFEHFGVDEKEFWDEVRRLVEFHEKRGERVNGATAYLNHMITYVEQGIFGGLSNELLARLGAKIKFFDGLPEAFRRLSGAVRANSDFKRYDIGLEHYIVSTGLLRLIQGSAIAGEVKDIWACEFVEHIAMPSRVAEREVPAEGPKSIRRIGYWLDDTSKTRAVFEINKGTNVDADIDVNATIPLSSRRVPFTNMVYIADGPTDIPVFSLLNQLGGRTCAVFPPGSPGERYRQVYDLHRQGRVQYHGPADYRGDSPTMLWLGQTIDDIGQKIVEVKEQALRSTVQPPPTHLSSPPAPRDGAQGP